MIHIMIRCRWTVVVAVVGLFSGQVITAAEPEQPKVEMRGMTASFENVLGTSLELVVYAKRPEAAEQVETSVLAEIDRLSAIVSTWDPQSDFSRWNHPTDSQVAVSPELFELFSRSDRWQIASRGAFNPGVQGVCQLWKEAGRNQRLPDEVELATAVKRAAAIHWKLDASRGTAQRLSDAPLTFDALAKGMIVEWAAAAAIRNCREVDGVVVAIGGDLRVIGDCDHLIQITNPFANADNAEPLAQIVLRNKAVATSGGYRRGVQIGSKWYSHLIDPRTGRPVDHIAGSTVIADNTGDADALATICSVLPVDESLDLVERTSGAACLLVTREGRIITSQRWSEYTKSTPPSTATTEQFRADSRSIAAVSPIAFLAFNDEQPKPVNREKADAAEESTSAAWLTDHELLVEFEINKAGQQGRRYRRPYVAVWIENSEGQSMRTLAVWYQRGKGDRWLNDLRRWTRSDKKRRETDNKDILKTISGATRAPGKYKLQWDGRDDAGKLVPQGKYTVYLEVAREHGTYQLMKEEVEVKVGMKPFSSQLNDNAEVHGATIEYRKKSPSADK